MGKIYVDIFDIEQKKIDINEALNFVTNEPNGAETLFVGTVRNHNLGKKVLGVSYDIFDPLAKKSFSDICQEAQEKWGDELDIYLVHTKGRLNIGDISIIIAIGSPHRDEAFKACRYIIEQIKHRSAIWKLEHYQDGDSEWSKGCELCTHEHKAKEHEYE